MATNIVTNRQGLMRIGELSRRTGMAEATLRAWERRYGIPVPARTEGGHRLYSERDVDRLARIQRLVEQGWSVGAAARRVGSETAPQKVALVAHRPSDKVATLSERLWTAIERFDDLLAHRAVNDALAQVPVVTFVDEILVPIIRRIHADESADPRTVARLNYGSQVLRARLTSLLTDLSGSTRGTAMITCVEGETNDLAVVAGAVVMADAGWHVRYFGAGMTNAAIEAAVRDLAPDVLMVASFDRLDAERFLAEPRWFDGIFTVLAGRGFESADARPPRSIVHRHGPLGSLPAEVADAFGVRA